VDVAIQKRWWNYWHDFISRCLEIWGRCVFLPSFFSLLRNAIAGIAVGAIWINAPRNWMPLFENSLADIFITRQYMS
jgi:hypothetical protein